MLVNLKASRLITFIKYIIFICYNFLYKLCTRVTMLIYINCKAFIVRTNKQILIVLQKNTNYNDMIGYVLMCDFVGTFFHAPRICKMACLPQCFQVDTTRVPSKSVPISTIKPTWRQRTSSLITSCCTGSWMVVITYHWETRTLVCLILSIKKYQWSI